MQESGPDELKNLLDAGASVFLKLWKPGCGVCKLSEPATRRMEADQLFAGVKFLQINVDEHPEMLEASGTESLPTFFVFKDKSKKGMTTGFKGIEKLKNFLIESLATVE